MQASGNEYRQQVQDFQARLNSLVTQTNRGKDRVMIDTTRRKTFVEPSRSESERFTIYGRRRYFSIARVMALMQVLREREQLWKRNHPVRVEAVGAYWQAYTGTTESPACHTCPALLMLDGQLPTLMTSHMGLRRHLIVTFADCMLMPQFINKIDRNLDDVSGWPAFAQAASLVLNDRKTWQEAVEAYTESMRQMFPEMLAIIHRDTYISDPEQRRTLDAMKAFYQGLFLTGINGINRVEMENFIAAV